MALIYERNFKKISKLFPFLLNSKDYEVKRLKAGGFMDLVVEILEEKEDLEGNLIETKFSMAHYYEQNGDLVPDPEMVLAVYWPMKMVEALEFTTQGYYRKVYFENKTKVDIVQKKEQNSFLEMWLRNIQWQGHRL